MYTYTYKMYLMLWCIQRGEMILWPLYYFNEINYDEIDVIGISYNIA